MIASVAIRILLGVLFAAGACFIGAGLVFDLIMHVYHLGYMQGRRDAANWWTQAAADVSAMQQQMKAEDRDERRSA